MIFHPCLYLKVIVFNLKESRVHQVSHVVGMLVLIVCT